MNSRKLEILLIMSKEPLLISQVKQVLNLTEIELLHLVDEINRSLAEEEKGYEIITFKGHLQLATTSLYQELLDEFFSTSKKKGLTDAALEVLAAVAYRGPITKAQINELRGVNSDYALSTLLQRELIHISGNLDTVGNPYLYSVTDTFYKVFSIENPEELR